MRNHGEYIIDRRLKFKSGLQKKFIREIKNKSGLTWKFLSNQIGISEYTLRVDWQKERSTLPYNIVISLLNKYPFEKFEIVEKEWIEKILPEKWGQKLAGNKNRKVINIPKKSEELAEIFGVVLGDGHLERRTLTITGNAKERAHYEYIKKTIKKLFDLNSKIFQSYTNKNTIVLRVYSTELIIYFKKNNLVLGDKIKNRAFLPRWIFKRKSFMYGALRGLFDTDGGIYYKQKNYKRAIIEFQTHSPYIRKDLKRLLQKIGFASSKSAQNVRIQNQNEIYKFFRIIGSSNPKNVVRYEYFLKSGYIPLKEKLNKQIINFKIKRPYKQP